MLRRDYIQRMIEEYARVLAHALGLQAEGRGKEALKDLQAAYGTFFNEEPELIKMLVPSQLLKRLIEHDGLTTSQVEIFAQGLRIEADLLMDSDPREAKDRYVKALALYEYVEFTDSTSYSIPRKHAIEEIKYCISAL